METPESLAAQLERFADHGWLNIVGGCCGTTPAHIRAIVQMVEGKRPRAVREPSRRAYYAGIELMEAEESNRPLLVGERTNVVGSRAFRGLVEEGRWEEAAEIARRQAAGPVDGVRAGGAPERAGTTGRTQRICDRRECPDRIRGRGHSRRRRGGPVVAARRHWAS